MVTQKEFIQLYEKKSPEEYIQMRTCCKCSETNAPYIDSSDSLDVKFYCTSHWLEKSNEEVMEISRQQSKRNREERLGDHKVKR